MSTPRLESLAPPAPGTDPFDTALITRLAREFFTGEVGEGPEESPSWPASVPASVPATPTASTGRESTLSGGFPSADRSAPPPVHPTVVAAEPAPLANPPAPPSGEHVEGTEDVYEFGEPRCHGGQLNPGPLDSRGAGRAPESRWGGFDRNTPAPLPTTPESTPEFYFLRGIADARRPATFGRAGLGATPVASGFDIGRVRRDFPALHQKVNGRPLVWLDNAATTHKPQAVIDAISNFYAHDNSNIHRAAHTLAARSTELFEAGREKARRFLGASDTREIVFVRGTTEAINLVAQSYGRQNIGAGDEIVLSTLEHHANIVPWQLLAQQTGAVLRVIPANARGELRLEELPGLLGPKTKLVSVTQVSNALGTVVPVEEIIALAHARGIPVLVDGAQSTPHMPVDVRALDADFFVFSGHKIFGPTGIGVLYGKQHLLESMPPWQGGGHMIRDVTFERTQYNGPPEKFEAGTPDISGVVGLGAAIDYLHALGLPAIAAYEHALLEYATEALASVPGLRPIGTAARKASVLSFVIPGVPNEKVARHLDEHGIAVRAGHHCAQPAVRHFGVEGTVRPSLAFYNTAGEVDALVAALRSLPRT